MPESNPLESATTVPPEQQQKSPQTISSADDHTGAFPPNPDEPKTLDFLAPAQNADELGRLAHYRVLKELGRGGMGCVLLAEDTRLERKVALKVMLPKFAEDAKAKERFLREARAAAKIKHDNIVTIFHVDEDRGVPFIALEFLQGEPLDKYAKEKGVLPLGCGGHGEGMCELVPRVVRRSSRIWSSAVQLGVQHATHCCTEDPLPWRLGAAERYDQCFTDFVVLA